MEKVVFGFVGIKLLVFRWCGRVVNQPLGEFVAGEDVVHFLFEPFGDEFEDDEADEDTDAPFEVGVGVFGDDGFVGGEAPEVVDGAGGEEVGDEAGGDHADDEADEVADVVGVEVFEKFSYDFEFHKSWQGLFEKQDRQKIASAFGRSDFLRGAFQRGLR